MLKIKDGVNLKELEKFGFEKLSGNSQVWQLNLEVDYSKPPFGANMFFIAFLEKDRILEIGSLNSEYSTYKLDIIYDLIKADLVEKV